MSKRSSPDVVRSVRVCLVVLISTLTLAQTHPLVAIDHALASRSEGPSGRGAVVNGDAIFLPVIDYLAGGDEAAWAAVADVNGDGKLDLLVANSCGAGNCAPNAAVGVLLGNGDGTFQAAVTYGGALAYSVAVADVNRDGKPDLLMANGDVGVMLGNGDGTFQTPVLYGPGGSLLFPAYRIAVGDLNGDGNPDLLETVGCLSPMCLGSGVGVFLGNGDGTFQAAVIYDSGGPAPGSVVVADVNGDGKLDALVANRCESVTCDEFDDMGLVGVLLNISTSTSLLSSLNPSSVGQAVTFTATISRFGNQAPTGTVSFLRGKQGPRRRQS